MHLYRHHNPHLFYKHILVTMLYPHQPSPCPVAGHLIPIQLIALHKGLAQLSLAPAARRGAHGVAPQALGHAGVVNGVEIVEAKEALKAGASPPRKFFEIPWCLEKMMELLGKYTQKTWENYKQLMKIDMSDICSFFSKKSRTEKHWEERDNYEDITSIWQW